MNDAPPARARVPPPHRTARPAAEAAFRALVEERLRNLEAQLAEVKTRLNGLLFFIAGTVITQVLLRLVA